VTDNSHTDVFDGGVTEGKRDLRLDAFRGLALWFTFIDHLPNNVLSWLTMRNYAHDRAGGEALPYTHEFLSHILGANRKSVTLAAQSMQTAGLISYHRRAIQGAESSRLGEGVV
jgi:hypothetical protein